MNVRTLEGAMKHMRPYVHSRIDPGISFRLVAPEDAKGSMSASES